MSIRIKSQALFKIAFAVKFADKVEYDLRKRIADELVLNVSKGEFSSVDPSQDDCAIIASVCLRRGIGTGKLFAIAGAPEKVEVPETVTRGDVLAAEDAYEELQRPAEPQPQQGSLFTDKTT